MEAQLLHVFPEYNNIIKWGVEEYHYCYHQQWWWQKIVKVRVWLPISHTCFCMSRPPMSLYVTSGFSCISWIEESLSGGRISASWPRSVQSRERPGESSARSSAIGIRWSDGLHLGNSSGLASESPTHESGHEWCWIEIRTGDSIAVAVV